MGNLMNKLRFASLSIYHMGSILVNLIISLFPPNTALEFLYTCNASFGVPYTVSSDRRAESDNENDEPPIQKKNKAPWPTMHFEEDAQ